LLFHRFVLGLWFFGIYSFWLHDTALYLGLHVSVAGHVVGESVHALGDSVWSMYRFYRHDFIHHFVLGGHLGSEGIAGSEQSGRGHKRRHRGERSVNYSAVMAKNGMKRGSLGVKSPHPGRSMQVDQTIVNSRQMITIAKAGACDSKKSDPSEVWMVPYADRTAPLSSFPLCSGGGYLVQLRP